MTTYHSGESPANLKVKYGTTDYNEPTVKWRDVEYLKTHERFDMNHPKLWDVSLIIVKEKIVFNEKVQPVGLTTQDSYVSEFAANFISWRSKLSVSKPPPSIPRSASLFIVNYYILDQCLA